MKENIRRAAEVFLSESDRREINIDKFFHVRGLVGIPVFPQLVERSPIFICDGGHDGTVVPRVECILGEEIGMKVLSEYFTIRDHTFAEPLWSYQVVELPEVQMIGTKYEAERKGLIDGKAKPKS